VTSGAAYKPPFHGLLRKINPSNRTCSLNIWRMRFQTPEMQRYNRFGERHDYALSTIPVSIMMYSYSLFYLLMFMMEIARTSSSSSDSVKLRNISAKSLNGIMGPKYPILVAVPALLVLARSYWIISIKCLFDVPPYSIYP
jgi:hypothetical protein